MKRAVAILVIAAWAFVIACASSSKSMTGAVPPTVQSSGPAPMPGSPQDQQIADLWNKLEADRQAMELAPPNAPFACAGPACGQGAQEMAAGATAPTLVCKPAETETCTQSCTLADSICSNAKQICELAGKLDGDQWAAKKCSDGAATCKTAKTRCCDCTK